MKKISILSIILFTATMATCQFKNDNVLYKTIFPKDLCNELRSGKDYLLLDVRSKGEYGDSSTSAVYNLGHLKNALNIDVSELGKNISKLGSDKNKTIYVYCSHSQRSRRASKMLADSGFVHVVNVNGGVTAIRQLPAENCINNLLVTTVGYKIISAVTLCKKLENPGKIFLLDVRSDSAFRHIDRAANINAFGTFGKSVNIPLADLKKRITEIPAGKEIIITDIFGDDAAQAASILLEKKYQNVSILLEGVNRMHYSESKELACLQNNYSSPVKYHILSSPDFKRLVEKDPDYLPLDIRPTDEYNNKAKDYWKNIGHLKQAVNIPLDQLAAKLDGVEQYKNKTVVLYSFSGGPDAYEAANILMSKGFSNVNVLVGGLFNIRWTAGNVEGYSVLSELVVDVPAENL